MDIQLKKIYFSERLSEETNHFAADLYINKKKAGYVKNDGHGGCTFYHAYDVAGRKLIEQAEKHCAGLPPEIVKFGDKERTFKQSLESVIDGLFEDYLKAKTDKQLLKSMEKGICYEAPTGYVILPYKGYTLKQVMATPQGTAAVINTVKRLKSEGKVILNTNFTPEILAGI